MTKFITKKLEITGQCFGKSIRGMQEVGSYLNLSEGSDGAAIKEKKTTTRPGYANLTLVQTALQGK